MRYSFALAALSAGSAVMAGLSNELPDGQVQEQVSAPAAPVPAAEATAFSTVNDIITSCAPTVENCPAHKTVVPVVPVSSPSPIQAGASSSLVGPPVIATPSPSSPSPNQAGASSTYLVGPPVIATPSPSSLAVPVLGQAGASGSPQGPVSGVPALGQAGASACPTCPSCSPVTVLVTVTATPTPAAAGSTGSPSSGSSSGSPSNGESGSSGSGSPSNGQSGSSGSASPSGNLPLTPGSTVSVPAGGAGGVAAASGTAAASTGAVTAPGATSSPITPFKGAASTVGSSIAVAGLAAFAAIFLA